MATYTVTALWDGEAKVWVATSEDIPGLIAEANTVELLMDQVTLIARDLLSYRSAPGGRVVMNLGGQLTRDIETPMAA